MTKHLFIILILAIPLISCGQEIGYKTEVMKEGEYDFDEYGEYCNQFDSETECDLEKCQWDVKVKCAVPGKNCGFGYTGIKECFPKE